MRFSSLDRRGFVAAAAGAPFALAQGDDPLRTLQKNHPRIIASAADFERVRALIKKDEDAARVHARLTAEADRLLSAPTVEYKLIGPRLLQQSRACLARIYTLAAMYRIDGRKEYLDRALKELRAASEFKDWNPSHFLDVAEMTHAFAIGLDWLWSDLSPEDRAWIRRAIVEKGLDPGLAVYRSNGGWPRRTNNWNQVCNGGMAVGALAVAEDEPERAREIIRAAVASLPLAMAYYAPDGGWNEGPGYWAYATRYTVFMLAALNSALGSDFGLSNSPGFNRAGRFRVYCASPTGLTFNYADGSAQLGPVAPMFWLARRFSDPVYASHQREYLRKTGRGEALDLIWWQDRGVSPRDANWSLNAYFKGVDVAFLRSDWDDPGAVFVAAKGGDNKAPHGHLDLGAFILDAAGVRWAADLGPDDYNLPAYFGAKRWTYYRMRTESHNTVLFDGENQDSRATARLTPASNGAVIDLAAAYPAKLSKHLRTITLNGREVRVVDAIAARTPVEALWGMVTQADVELSATRASLTHSGRKLAASIASPAGARFEVVSTEAPAPQNPNTGTRKVVVRLPEKITEVVIEVRLRPEG